MSSTSSFLRVVTSQGALSGAGGVRERGAPVDDLPQVGDRISGADGSTLVEVYSRASLPTRFGDFEIYVFRNNIDDLEHVALVRNGAEASDSVPVRLHSECLTGDVLGSLRCDCRDQFELAMRLLGDSNRGVLLYMRQEGRGIGLGNKIRAYALQEKGMDTYEANRHLGFDDDLRDYRVAALMLRLLGTTKVELSTNNPRKIEGLQKNGVTVVDRKPIVAEQNLHNIDYLATKARKSGHLLPY